jgi:methylmalonyl-CoA mutase cobalamin-binding domain/chain
MPSVERSQELIKSLFESVINMDEDAARVISNAILNEEVDAYSAITRGLTAAMEKVGVLYANHEYFVPELLLCSDALYASLEILKPHVKIDTSAFRKKIILGTVEGDIHDIGKNLVKIMFEAAGWEVYDLGNDVRISRFVEEQKRVKADLVGLSALMSTSMLAIPKIIELLRAEDKGVMVMAGGAPLNRDIAAKYGANGYAANAGEAVQEALRLLEAKSK